MKKTTIKCPKCGYEWKTASKLRFVSCPSCLCKVLR
jgi:DNA-directed RNA polymerase subunit RPC12/RpoP